MLDKFLYESLNWLMGITSKISAWAWRKHVKILRKIQSKRDVYRGTEEEINKENEDYVKEIKNKL